jgi:hypothetical protein
MADSMLRHLVRDSDREFFPFANNFCYLTDNESSRTLFAAADNVQPGVPQHRSLCMATQLPRSDAKMHAKSSQKCAL